MIRFEDLTLFVRVAALGSFSKAAREAGLLPGQASAAIQRLERELTVQLFVRSTRSLRLTPQGINYLPFAIEMLELLKSGQEAISFEGDELQKEIRIALPSDIGRNILLPLITAFCNTHPKISFQIIFSDGINDLYRDPVDVVIRYGALENKSYIAFPLVEDNKRVLVASPDYLARKGSPKNLEELMKHDCVLFSLNGYPYSTWVFPGSHPENITVNSRLCSNDAEVAHRWAVSGVGIAYKSRIDVQADIEAGRLKVLLPELPGEPAPLNFICPNRRQFSPSLRALYNYFKYNLKHFSHSS